MNIIKAHIIKQEMDCGKRGRGEYRNKITDI